MTSLIKELTEQKLISPPDYVNSGIQYETIMGSVSYGVSNDASDVDVYGFCIPPRDIVFPHVKGEIQGFGRQIQRFEQYQQHHIKSLCGQKEYDVSIYNIVKFFQLCMENNPNMVDSLYTPERCVLYKSKVGGMVRDNRDMFLHKGSWHKFKGYAYAQMTKIKNKTNRENPKRAESIEKFGYDVKFAYHVVRLIDEVEQILMHGTLDLERNREQLKSIRRGEWTFEEIEQHFQSKEAQLEALYTTSTLRHSPDEDQIKALLLNCLEEHYGSLDNMIAKTDRSPQLIADLLKVVAQYR